MIPVGPLPKRFVHEQVARYAAHRREHARLCHPARYHLLLHHALSIAGEALRPRLRILATDHR
jgi:hypothetical protein